jgi:hypothetical protein
MFSNSTTVRRFSSEDGGLTPQCSLLAAAGKKFAALVHDRFHGGGELFSEGLLVHYVDFDDNTSARLGLRAWQKKR